jgi:N-methylhydantoinase B
MAKTDPFTLEVIQNTIDAITDEMFAAMRRAAHSTVIYEVLDFGVAIADAKGDLASQGAGIPLFIGMLDPGFRAVVHRFADKDAVEPGDIFICNDPWAGGASHLNDVSLIMPVFASGALIAWTACKGHWSDIGGMVAGSVAMDAVEVFQEGLRFPLMKLFERGTPVSALLEMIRTNSRLPDAIIGDMWAGVSAVRLGARRIEEVASTYGLDAVEAAFEAYQRYGESVSMNALKELPKGTFRAFGSLEALGDIQVNVTVTNQEFTVDLRGNPAPVRGPANCPYEVTLAAAKVAFKAITSPESVCNAGSFRPLRVICDDNSMFAAKEPAPVGIYHEPAAFLTELILRSLAEHVPTRVGAGSFGSVGALVIGGTHHETGKPFCLIEPEVGGWGASYCADGENAQFSAIDGETYNTPIEINEARHDLVVQAYGFHGEDGGEGQFRGGRGVVLEYRLLSHAWTTGIFTPNFLTRPWSMNGGASGSSNRVVIRRADGREETYGKFSNVPLEPGDVVRVITGHGGGWGDPKHRAVEDIEKDLENEFISESHARTAYGYTRKRLGGSALAPDHSAPID